MTEPEYLAHSDAMDGFCTTCNAVTRDGDTEPDARRYECPVCGELTVYGVEEALMRGYIEIEED